MSNRGGRRPGAGAPRGNTNALSSGRFSSRYADARLILRAIPDLKLRIDALAAAGGPATEAQRRLYLEAAAWTAAAFPELAAELEQIIALNLAQRAAEVRKGEAILYILRTPRNPIRPLPRAIGLTLYLQTYDPVLGPILTDHILSRLNIAPIFHKKLPSPRTER